MATPLFPPSGSPLLQLPGELRNKINRYIFKQEDRILLVPYVGPPGPSAPVMNRVAGQAIPDLDLFTICRQFYGEARSSFLSDNTFMLTTEYNSFIDASSLGLLVEWMASLGPYRDYVRKVIIDLEPLCPGNCHLAIPSIDFLSIMAMIWRYQAILTTHGNRQHAKIEISFAFSGENLRGHAHQSLPTPYPISESNLNTMVTLLRPQRIPAMSPYIRSHRVLRGILVRLNGLRALFVLSTPHHRDGTEYPVIEYEVDSNNQLVRRPFEFNREVGIDRLLYPTSVREKLLGLLLDSDTTQLTYNIERQTISRRLPEAFSINRRFRELALEKYPNVHIIGKFTSHSAQATYSDLALVQNWTAASRLFIRAEPGRDQNDPPTILLRFELSEREELSNLRIPITNIIMATLQLPLNTEVQVELVCGDLPVRVKTATLYRLQREMLVFLSDILDAHPTRSTETCPDVQMNGKCVIEEVEYEREDGSKFSIKNQKPDLNSEQMEEEMDFCISKLIEQNEVDISAYVPTLPTHQERWDWVDGQYDLSAPHHPSLLGVATKLACFLQEAGTVAGYYS